MLNLSNLSNLPAGFPIQLPGGWTLMPPSASGMTAPSAALPGLGGLNLQSLLSGAQGGAPDLSGAFSALSPILGAAVPQLAPFLPIIGVLLQILHSLSTQMHAAAASGTANPSLQLVHDAAWSQALALFSPKPAQLPAPAAA